jgi:serine/threonine protein kinase
LLNPDRRSRFKRESKIPAALNHPNIITIYDIAEHEGRSFIDVEFVAGAPLNELIPKGGMAAAGALNAAVEIADPLAVAHAARIVSSRLKARQYHVLSRWASQDTGFRTGAA